MLGEITALAPQSKVIVLTGQNDRANALRAIGTDSLDWLGVPMLQGDLVRGAIVVQSYVLRERYSAADEALLTKLSENQPDIAEAANDLTEQLDDNYVSLQVATNVLVMATLTIGTMILFNKKLTARIRRNNYFGDKLNRICVDYLNNIVTVKTLGVEEAAIKHLRAQKDGVAGGARDGRTLTYDP